MRSHVDRYAMKFQKLLLFIKLPSARRCTRGQPFDFDNEESKLDNLKLRRRKRRLPILLNYPVIVRSLKLYAS